MEREKKKKHREIKQEGKIMPKNRNREAIEMTDRHQKKKRPNKEQSNGSKKERARVWEILYKRNYAKQEK